MHQKGEEHVQDLPDLQKATFIPEASCSPWWHLGTEHPWGGQSSPRIGVKQTQTPPHFNLLFMCTEGL